MPSINLKSVDNPNSFSALLPHLNQDGAVIVKNLLSPHVLTQLSSELFPYTESTKAGNATGDEFNQNFYGHKTKRFCGLCQKSATFVQLLSNSVIRGYADHYLLPLCGNYWINTGEMMVVQPGEARQMLHRDEENWPYIQNIGHILVAMIIALDDFTIDNGATVIVPGSHLWNDLNRKPQEHELSAAIMQAGSAVFYLGKTIHGAGINRTLNKSRAAIHLSFTLGWLRAEENHYLSNKLPDVLKLSPDIQTLLGFRSYLPKGEGGRLGMIDCEDSAIALLAE